MREYGKPLFKAAHRNLTSSKRHLIDINNTFSPMKKPFLYILWDTPVRTTNAFPSSFLCTDYKVHNLLLREPSCALYHKFTHISLTCPRACDGFIGIHTHTHTYIKIITPEETLVVGICVTYIFFFLFFFQGRKVKRLYTGTIHKSYTHSPYNKRKAESLK